MDNFNGDVHTRMLPRLGTNHSHLIPVEDYGRLERAVADALRDTVGAEEARALEDRLLAKYRQPFNDRCGARAGRWSSGGPDTASPHRSAASG
jgi:hypothetical protein